MEYNHYKNSRDHAWEILIKHNIQSLPVKIKHICKLEGITVVDYNRGWKLIQTLNIGSHIKSNDGLLILEPSVIILYNSNCTNQRQRFVIAHELGHYILKHTGMLTNREPNPLDNQIETEANIFASRLLAPSCVMWALDIHTPTDIAELCDISLQSAGFRAERLDLLYKRENVFLNTRGYSNFLMSPLERQVYKQFANYLRQKKQLPLLSSY